MAKCGYTYILASRKNGTLYIGVTSDLIGRVRQHREDARAGFTAAYSVHQLVYFETHRNMIEAIRREKCMKKWRRSWKIEAIEKHNPQWQDLYPHLERNPHPALSVDFDLAGDHP